VLTVAVGQTIDAMYMGFYSDVLPTNHDHRLPAARRQPKLHSVTGVQTAELLGARLFALRAWLDADKLAAYGLTAADVSTALATNNYLAALGAPRARWSQCR
jgi:multidrug efflux pump